LVTFRKFISVVVFMRKLFSGLILAMVFSSSAQAQMRPPIFMGGVPGLAQSRAIFLQRHQSRTLLYREALEELRKNPAAADLPECSAGQTNGSCLTAPRLSLTEPVIPAAVAPAPMAPAGVAPTGRRIALLVGNNEYAKPIPPLETPIADVSKIARLLEDRFGFDTRIIKNAGQTAIIGALNKIAADARPNDSVLLFYAGHGYLMEDIEMGFWIPVDASVKTARGWISNKDISKLLSAIPARQLILISDSCFSGTLTKEQKVSTESTAATDELLQRRSVLALSSGGDEPVSDEGKQGHSIFAWNLIKALEETGGITPGAKVWKTVHGGVSREYPQEPQYGAVVSAGHVAGGDYLFRPK
jgi:hypothetical protein